MAVTQGNIIVGWGETGTLKIADYGIAEGSATDIGGVEGGASLEVPREYYEKGCDQLLGITELYKTSEKAFLKVNIAEATLDSLRLAMDYPAAALAAGTLQIGGDFTVTYLTLYLNVVGVSGGTRKYTFHKAVCIAAASHSYKHDDKTVIECNFQILQDTSKTADQQLFSLVETAADTTPPTIAMTTPAAGGTVVKDAKGTVLLTITDTNAMDESSIKYGDDDDATMRILNVTTNTAITLVAGTIAYSSTAKTITFTPTANWTASNKHMVLITTGLRDNAGNRLASTFIGHFSVTA